MAIAPPPNSTLVQGVAPPPNSTLVGDSNVDDEEEEEGFFSSLFSSKTETPTEEPQATATPIEQSPAIAPPPNSNLVAEDGSVSEPIPQESTSLNRGFGRGRSQIFSPEYQAQHRIENAMLDFTAREVKAYDEQFGAIQRMLIRAAKGDLGKQIGALGDAVTDMYEARAKLYAEVEAEEGMPDSGMPLREKTLNDIAVSRGMQIDSLTKRIKQAEDDLVYAQLAQAKPQVAGPGGLEDTPIDVPVHPAMLAIQKADGNPAFQTRIMNHFFPEVLGEVLVTSVVQMGWKQLLVPGGLALVGKYALGSRLAAEAAFATGNAAVSYSVETDASFMDFMQGEGFDFTKPEDIERALSDPALVKKARAFSRKRGVGVGVWDWAAAFLAAKRLFPPGLKGKMKQNFVNTATQIAVQTGFGGAGEASAQVLSGEEFNSLEIKLEILGGIGPAVVEPAVFQLANQWNKKPKGLDSLKKVIQTAIEKQDADVSVLFEALKEMSAQGLSYEEAADLLMSIPGVKLNDLDEILKDGHSDIHAEDSYSPTKATERALDDTVYETTSGATKTGKDIFADTDEKGNVYWATDQRVDTAALPASRLSTVSLIKELEKSIKLITKEIMVAKASQEPASGIALMERMLEGLTERYQQKLQENIAMQELRPQLHKLVQELVRVFMPNETVLILEDNLAFDKKSSDRGGSAGRISRHGGSTVAIIYLNTTDIMDLSLWGKSKSTKQRNAVVMTGVLSHEFGHTLMHSLIKTLPDEVRGALEAEHRNWIKKAAVDGMGIWELMNSKMSSTMLHSLKGVHGNASATVPVANTKNLPYHLSLTEYMADMMARSFSDKDNTVISPVTKRFIPRIAKIMQRYFDKSIVRGAPEETFETFLKYIKAREQLNRIQDFEAAFTPGELDKPLSGSAGALMEITASKSLEVPQEIIDVVEKSLDTYNGLVRNFLTLLQLEKENPHIKGLRQYVEAVHQHWVTKSNWNDQAMQTLNAWRELGKVGDEVGRFLLARSVLSDELSRKLTNDEIQDLLEVENINFGKKADKAWAVVERVEGDLANSLNELYIIEKNRINKDWADMNTMRLSKLQALDKLFDQLRDRNYFPLSRFGKLGIVIKATKTTTVDGKSYVKGDSIHMEMFETKKQRNKALGKLRRKFGPSFNVEMFQIQEDMQSFSGMPLAIMRQLKDNPAIGLNEEQRARMQDLIDIMSPTQSIAKRMLERKGTAGFSADAARGYGNYMMQIGGHIAKMKHMGQMDAAIDSVNKSARYLGSQGIVNDKRYEISEHLSRHKEYIMNPEAEWGAMRALAFHWFLGFNPKSAMVNLTQIPLVAYPYIAARAALTGSKIPGVSDAIAIAALTKAMAEVGNFFRNGVNKYSPEAQEMFDILTAEGIIDESLATELAQQAHGDMISKILPAENKLVRGGQRAFNALARGSTIMFQAAEKLNRRVVAKAVFDLAKARGMSQAEAVSEAREALRTTQFEYARWNRAAFMRGKKGVLFVFMQYLQNTLYFVSRDPGAIRYTMMMFMAAGLQGLPGAEDLMDVLDVFSTKFKKWLKIETDPRADIRQALREYIIALGGNPEFIMHGLAAQSMGLGMQTVNDMLGTSMPSFSLEGSVSAGRVVPGLEALTEVLMGHQLSGAGAIGAAKDVAGAAITIPVDMMRALVSTDPSLIRLLERTTPSIIKSNLRAWRARTEGKLTDRSGKTIVEFDMSNYEHMAEILGMHLGLTPTRLAREQEVRWAQKEATQFYVESRARMQVVYNYAQEQVADGVTGAEEDLANVEADIDRFNRNVPDGQQMYTHPQGYVNYEKAKAFNDAGLDGRILNQPVRDTIRKSFTPTEENIP